MTCSRSTGMTDLSMPPSRAMTSACSWALSPSTSLTSNEDVEDGLWAALDAGTSRAHATARKAMMTTARFSTVNGLVAQVSCHTRPTDFRRASPWQASAGRERLLGKGFHQTRLFFTALCRWPSRAQQLAQLLHVWR